MALLSHITNQIKLKIDYWQIYLRLQVRWESNWFEFIHFWGCVSSLKLKCVTGFGDKVSPVSEILKSQGWPVPPRPPHFGRLCFLVQSSAGNVRANYGDCSGSRRRIMNTLLNYYTPVKTQRIHSTRGTRLLAESRVERQTQSNIEVMSIFIFES